MDNKFIGRKREITVLKDALDTSEAEMIAVVGRRRVGKTYLVNTIYEKQIVFEITGLQNSSMKEQLENFVLQLSEFSESPYPIKTPTSWLQAFALLIAFLKQQKSIKKPVVFFDELPWLATHKSGFLNGFSYFWNSWAVKQNIVVVICGSSASWMIQKVVNSKGGLHNRITRQINLSSFSLAETEAFLKSKNLKFNRYQIVQMYMALGGIPHYLKEIKGGQSAVQNINRICFIPNARLKEEFLRLYPALFSNANTHISVIRALASKWQGLTRKEIATLSNVSEGGSLTRTLEELIQSGFISIFRPFGNKKKQKLYRLSDEYSLFYLKFIEGKEFEGNDVWNHLSQTQLYKTWSGYAFENICLKHVPQIKKALNISGVYSISSSFYHAGTKEKKGTQIDLLIDRNDDVINIFEIKFYKDTLTIDKTLSENLTQKQSIFKDITKSKKQIFISIITTFGLKENEYSKSIIHQVLTLDDLFEEVF